MRTSRAMSWLWAGWLSCASVVHAESASDDVPYRAPEAAFWRAFTHPEQQRAAQLVRQGRALLYPALGLGLLFGSDVSGQKRLAIESALARFSEAVALDPRQRDARLFYGKALAFWEDRAADGTLITRTDEAITQLEALRQLDPQYEMQEVSFQLGVLHTRRGDFARAVHEYRHALAVRSDDERDHALLGNLAEVTMLAGDLPEALALYERSARDGEGGSRVLALWGSAVVLDRLGERRAALLRARRALEEDRAPFAVLHQTGVFFVPPEELHYYEGLGQLALIERERSDRDPASSSAAYLARALQRLPAWLDKPDSIAAVNQFERVLSELHEGPLEAASAGLRTRVTRARERLQRTPDVPKSDVLPANPDARVALWTLRACASFDLYLRKNHGPFAEDAREHLTELERALGR